MADRVDVEGYFRSRGWSFKKEGKWAKLEVCPYCKGGGGSKDKYTLAVNMETGAGKCHRASCGWVGGITKLRIDNGDLTFVAPAKPIVNSAMPDWQSASRFLQEQASLLTELKEKRGLTPETARRFGFGVIERTGVTVWAIPYRSLSGEITYIKFKSVKPDGSRICWRTPAGVDSLLWGSDRVTGFEQIIVVEGEEDAAVLAQAGVANVVSVPDGASISVDSRNRLRWVDLLERFTDIVLCLDNDEPGRKGQAALAKMLGESRCRIVVYPDTLKDACDYAAVGRLDELVEAISQAAATAHPLIAHVGDSELLTEIKASWKNPSPHGETTGWHGLDDLLGGIRPGELTILTGHTGSGKSAFAANLVIQAAQQGTPAMLASLELSTQDVLWRIIQRLVGKYPWAHSAADAHMAMTEDDLDSALDQMGGLPLHLLRRFGALDIGEYISCIEYTTRRFGAKLHVLDHLHFATVGAGENERHVLTDAVYRLKMAARDLKTSIWAVAHPSRMARGKMDPDITDLHGAASLEQIADNVVTIARLETEGHTSFESTGKAQIAVKKLRQGRSGRLGRADFMFYPWAERFEDVVITPQIKEEEGEDSWMNG